MFLGPWLFWLPKSDLLHLLYLLDAERVINPIKIIQTSVLNTLGRSELQPIRSVRWESHSFRPPLGSHAEDPVSRPRPVRFRDESALTKIRRSNKRLPYICASRSKQPGPGLQSPCMGPCRVASNPGHQSIWEGDFSITPASPTTLSIEHGGNYVPAYEKKTTLNAGHLTQGQIPCSS